MYEFVDRPVTSLNAGGRFLIWSMRSWVASAGGENCPARVIAPAFASWNMIGGLQAFHRMMLILNRDALEAFRFCALHCNHISEHEAIILSLLVALGEQGPAPVRDTLTLLLGEDSIGDLLGALSELAARMDQAAVYPCRPHPVTRESSSDG